VEIADYNLRMRNLLRYFLLALVLLAVALLSALTAMRLAIHGQEVSVPDLRGKTPVEARRIADDSGLALSVERSYYSPTVPEGKVLSQVPAPRTVVRRGWELRIALSIGPQRVTVPQLVGGSERAADLTLAQRGLEIDSVARTTLPGSTAEQVIGQNPSANSPNISTPKVSLLIAQADSPQAFLMPSFIGEPLGTAINVLHDAGFFVGRVTMAAMPPALPDNVTTSAEQEMPGPLIPSSPGPASIIVLQDPAPGAKVLAGAAINFIVK
jgi:beta-lactam-binding protein with PASTA domain